MEPVRPKSRMGPALPNVEKRALQRHAQGGAEDSGTGGVEPPSPGAPQAGDGSRHLTWRARAGRAPHRNWLKQHLGGGAGGAQHPALIDLDAGDASELLGLEPPPGGLGSWTIPRSCGLRHEVELRGEERERREAAGAAGAACRDQTAAGPPTGDALNNRGEEATRPRKLNLLAIHGKAQSREQRRLLQPGLNTEAGAPFPLYYGPPARAVTEPLRREQARWRRRICRVRV
ncbi:hypothetical protein NDU88_000435 [Pleurodeles waltl]|uniref:Uncharacterized protein n=1 Tax=Pleurodeles waltl TaxID=8319 RepID=A0AAV7V916_PLEWA|nr:hypothetical protein NDU88_000435 [Pleurodeles waltl]